ncbi:unnamed protein product [Auanema sp. JU1783]|nr:unnamed protein product [Auanema sp. JU1783]
MNKLHLAVLVACALCALTTVQAAPAPEVKPEEALSFLDLSKLSEEQKQELIEHIIRAQRESEQIEDENLDMNKRAQTFVRFGKRAQTFVRFGKRAQTFVRFG